jgi:hypothetical protein
VPETPEPAQEEAALLEGLKQWTAARGDGRREVRRAASEDLLVLGIQSQRYREQHERDGHDVREEPRRGQHRRVPVHRSKSEEERRQDSGQTVGTDPGGHAPRQADVDGADRDADQLRVRGQAEDGDERHDHNRRQRREGEQAVAVLAG